MNVKLIPVNNKELLLENQIFISPYTLYHWASNPKYKAKYGDFFVKQGKRLLLNVNKFHETFGLKEKI